MPELPEVEIIRRRISSEVIGRQIESIDVYAARQVWPTPDALKPFIGCLIDKVERKGKLLKLHADGRTLVFHLRMSGIVTAGPMLRPTKHSRLMMCLAGDTFLRFDDARRFGAVFAGPPFPEHIDDVAPDPLATDFDLDRVVRAASRSRRRLKPWLIDQKVMSGVGNIYADEALHRACLNPTISVYSISECRIKMLIKCLQVLLEEAIENGGSSIDWAFPGGLMQNKLQVYGRRGSPCVVCGTTLLFDRVDKRGTTWCPSCQSMSSAT